MGGDKAIREFKSKVEGFHQKTCESCRVTAHSPGIPLMGGVGAGTFIICSQLFGASEALRTGWCLFGGAAEEAEDHTDGSRIVVLVQVGAESGAVIVEIEHADL